MAGVARGVWNFVVRAWIELARLVLRTFTHWAGALLLLVLAILMLRWGIAAWPSGRSDPGDLSIFVSDPDLDLVVSMEVTERVRAGTKKFLADVHVQATRSGYPPLVMARFEAQVPLAATSHPEDCVPGVPPAGRPPDPSLVALVAEGIRVTPGSVLPGQNDSSGKPPALGAHIGDGGDVLYGELLWSPLCAGHATAEASFLDLEFSRPLVEDTTWGLRRRIVMPRLYAPPSDVHGAVAAFPFRLLPRHLYGPRAADLTVIAPPVPQNYEIKRALPATTRLDPLAWEETRVADTADEPISVAPDLMLERLDAGEIAGLLISMAAAFFLITFPALWRALLGRDES